MRTILVSNMDGFIDYQIDAVIKFGGSLLNSVETCRRAVASIVSLSRQGKRVVVLPGGGPTDNTIEALDREVHFHSDTHHYACALAQDQTGLMIADPSFSDLLAPVRTLSDARQCLANGKIPVLLPSQIIFAIDPFERTWSITSDSMAAWFAWLLHCPCVVILTDVDGLYPPEDIGKPDRLIREIDASDLIRMGHNAVDACFAAFVHTRRIDGWILNGAHPERIVELLAGSKPLGTFIRGRMP